MSKSRQGQKQQAPPHLRAHLGARSHLTEEIRQNTYAHLGTQPANRSWKSLTSASTLSRPSSAAEALATRTANSSARWPCTPPRRASSTRYWTCVLWGRGREGQGEG